MINRLLAFSAILFFAFTSFANSSEYYIDDEQVEQTLTSSVQIVINPETMEFTEEMMKMAYIEASDPNPWVAFALAWVLGGLGIHRVYLGGRGILILFYFITCGGIFGIIPLVDWIVLLVGAIKEDIGQYVNNDAFIMWN